MKKILKMILPALLVTGLVQAQCTPALRKGTSKIKMVSNSVSSTITNLHNI